MTAAAIYIPAGNTISPRTPGQGLPQGQVVLQAAILTQPFGPALK